MANYTYLFADLRTGVILNELPLYGVSISRELGRFGDFTATIGLDNSTIPNSDIKDCTIPGRTVVYVDRDGVIIYAGIIWTRTYNNNGKTLQMTGQDLGSYFEKRLISYRFATTNFVQTDQLAIAQSLLNQAQATVGGNIGIVVPTNSSFVLRDREYKPSELKPVAEAITQLSEVINGFDWEIDAAYDSGMNVVRSARFGYPYLGRSPQGTDLIWEYPGSILEYWWSEAATDSATTQWASGSGTADTNIFGVADDTDVVNQGYPVLERTTSYTDVTVQTTIDEHAKEDLRKSPVPVLNPSMHVRADVEPMFGSYDLGDHARFEILDPYFDQGFAFVRRIIGWRLTPASSENTESVDLTLGEPING